MFEILGHDAVAIAATISPENPIPVVGHDNGAFATYYALTYAPHRFSRAVTMTAGHPAAVFANTSKMPGQMWKSRYAFLFQIPKLSDWYAKRNGYAYLRNLWDEWSADGWTVPEDHFSRVQDVLDRSWPAPLEHYREMEFAGPEDVISVPTPYLIGEDDGCVDPEAAKGQERYFDELVERRISNAGHFLHLEKPDEVLPLITDWLTEREVGRAGSARE